uniref:G_PROTEIN_RECEP_F1_2 domain-containing protein n=1 Tax=Haemonchus contortus TaxID=6289 RepID=A0A7I4Y2E6_HAECO
MNCDNIVKVIHDSWFRTALFGQFIASIISAILSIFVVKKICHLYFHINTKVLLMAMLYLYIVHSFLIFITLAIHLTYYFFTDPCTLSVPSIVCVGLHFPAICCMLSFVILQFFMVVERSIALWKRQYYESYGPKLGITLVFLSVILPASTLVLAMKGVHRPRTAIYCGFADTGSAGNLIAFMSVMCGINLITLIIATVLLFLNKFLSKQKSYNLNLSYQLREGATIIRIILPLTSFQTIFCSVFFACILVFISFKDFVDHATVLILNVALYVC